MSTPASVHPAPTLFVRQDDAVPVLCIPPAMNFEAVRSWIREELPAQLDVVAGRSSRLDFADRDISLFDLRRLVHLLRDEFSIEVTGLYVRPEAIHRFAERELKLKLFVARPPEAAPPPQLEPEPAAVEPPPADDEELPAVLESADALAGLPTPEIVSESVGGRRSLSVHRTLRSGSALRFDGDVMVFGDVNPGAQVLATGNVVVLGTLKGMCHAGATGDETCFILGFDLQPTQLRIGRKIAIAPEREGPPKSIVPEVASVVEGQIVIEPYRGPFRR